jgi:hypothetical protein
LCQHRPCGLVQRLSSENKGVSPYIPWQAGYRSKKQGLIHIWLYTILLATLPYRYMTFSSQCYRTLFSFRFLISLCYAIPELRIGLFSSGPPPCYSIAIVPELVVPVYCSSVLANLEVEALTFPPCLGREGTGSASCFCVVFLIYHIFKYFCHSLVFLHAFLSLALLYVVSSLLPNLLFMSPDGESLYFSPPSSFMLSKSYFINVIYILLYVYV